MSVGRLGSESKMLRSLYRTHWSPLGESLYTLITRVEGCSVCDISRICISRSSYDIGSQGDGEVGARSEIGQRAWSG